MNEDSSLKFSSSLGTSSTILQEERADTPTSQCILPDIDISNIEDELRNERFPCGAVRKIKRQGSISQGSQVNDGETNSNNIDDYEEEDSQSDKQQSQELEDNSCKDNDAIQVDANESSQVNNLNVGLSARLSLSNLATTTDSGLPEIVEVRDLREEQECDMVTEEWKNKEKHVFVLSKAGKPIYSRYGDENRLATLMGVMQALVSFVADSDDVIKTIIAGEHKFVFLIREHLILVCVSRTWEATSHLLLLLNYVYQQIVSVLTHGTLHKQFSRHTNLDLRRLLNGTERFLDGIIDLMDNECGILLGAVRCLPLHPNMRDAVVQSITQGVKPRDLVFAILLADNQLVSIVRMKRHYPHPLDLHLLINIIRSSESFRNAQSWSPICLPKFDSGGFLYAYISYLDEKSVLILLTVNSSDFYSLHECRDRIVDRMNKSGCLKAISESCDCNGYSVASTGISELRHFLYKSKATAQYTSPIFSQPYSSDKMEEMRIKSHYYRLHQLIHKPSLPMKLVYQSTATETFLGWNTDNFEMYATFGPLCTKPLAISAVNKLMKWVQSEKERLFILTSPTF